MRHFKSFILFMLFGVFMLSAGVISAAEVPPTGAIASIQTSGPNTPPNIGDFYANSGQPHIFDIFVSCTITQPVVIALFDPEVYLTNRQDGPGAVDEPRFTTTHTPVFPSDTTVFDPINHPPHFDNATFMLTGPIIVPVIQTFMPDAPTHLQWVELARLDPTNGECGVYRLQATTADNDDNAWRFKAFFASECTTTPCTHAEIASATDDGNNADGSKIQIGILRTSYQHGMSSALSCQLLYFYVSENTPSIRLRNYDLDVAGYTVNITYQSADPARTYVVPPAEISNNAEWRESVLSIAPSDVGWWSAEFCTNGNNQYIFESPDAQPIFYTPPESPSMDVTKDDGLYLVSSAGQQVTYTIEYSNAGPGAAANVVIQDNLPAGATFVNCSDSCSGTGPVTWDIGTVPVGGSGSVTMTVNLPPAPAGTQHTNTVTLNYTDIVNNPFPEESDEDIDIVENPTPVPGFTPPPNLDPLIEMIDPYIMKSANPPFAMPGESVTWTITVRNPGTVAYTGVRVEDVMPAEVEILSVRATSGSTNVDGQRVTFTQDSLAAGASATITVATRVRESANPPYQIRNTACLTHAQSSASHCANAQVASVGQLPSTGETPRIPPVAVMASAILMFGIGGVWRFSRRTH